eukprot:5078698-Pyramimonas_sp.AAC.1
MSKVQPVPRLRTQLSQRSIAGVVCMSALKRETKSSIEPRSTGSGDLPLHLSLIHISEPTRPEPI